MPWAPLIALALSAAVFAVSLHYFQQRSAAENVRYVDVVVAKRTVPQHTLVTEADLALQKVHPDAGHPEAVREIAQAVGKTALSTIHEGEQIHAKRLAPGVPDRQEATIVIDMARSGGVAAGDLVDVYFLRDETPWAGARAPVAADAMVVAVLDAQGGSLSEEKAPQILGVSAPAAAPSLPVAVRLSLKPREVPWVVRGALPDNREYVLVKKFRPGINVLPAKEEKVVNGDAAPPAGGSQTPDS